MNKPVGLIIGTKPSNPLEFWVGVSETEYLQLDDVVVVRSTIPTGEEITFYGLVDIVEKSFQGLDFDADNELVQEGILPVSLSHIARVVITRVEPEFFIPPHPGQPVYRAIEEDFDKALFFDGMEHTIPAGMLQNGQPALLNYEFINGTKGGHISISGVSGVATKTSYALFLLHGIFHSPTLTAKQKNITRALIFNVKGEDLFFLDQPNAKLRDSDRVSYEKMGLPVTPFKNVKFHAPSRHDRGEILPDTNTRTTGIEAYAWTLWDVASQELFRFLFAEDSDTVSNLSFIIERISRRLKYLSEHCRAPHITDENNHRLSTLADLRDYLQEMVDEDDDWKNKWFGRNTPTNTIAAFMRRLDAAILHMKALLRPDAEEKHAISWSQQKVTVVDIQTLHARSKMFVVGAILKQLFREKEEKGAEPTVFVVLDELNRYAARSRWSPIKDILLDIAERGRSLGIILIGAQQTASEIERRVIANAAVKVNGRLDAAESSSREYDHLTGTFRKRSLMIKPGTMVIHQPELPSPLLVKYPFSAWATRQSEVQPETEADPFENF